MNKRQHPKSKPRMLRQIMEESDSLSDHRHQQPRKLIKMAQSKQKSKKIVENPHFKLAKTIKGKESKKKCLQQLQKNQKQYKKTRKQHKQVQKNLSNPKASQSQQKEEQRKQKKRLPSDVQDKKVQEAAILSRTRNRGQRKSILSKFAFDYDSHEIQKTRRQQNDVYYCKSYKKKGESIDYSFLKEKRTNKHHSKSEARSLTRMKDNQNNCNQSQAQNPLNIVNPKYQLNRIFRKIPRIIVPNVTLQADLLNFSFVSFMGSSIKASVQEKYSQQRHQDELQQQQKGFQQSPLALQKNSEQNYNKKEEENNQNQNMQNMQKAQIQRPQLKQNQTTQQRDQTAPFEIIHCSLPLQMLYQMPQISNHALQFRGFIFIWVEKGQIQLGYHLLNRWGFDVIDQIVWIKTKSKNQLTKSTNEQNCQITVSGNQIDYNDQTSYEQMLKNSVSQVAKEFALHSEKEQRTQEAKKDMKQKYFEQKKQFEPQLSGSLLKNCKSTCLVGYKCSSTNKVDYCTKISNNLIFAPYKGGCQKPDQIYQMADLIMPGCRKLQIGNALPSERGWFVLQHIQKSLKRCHQCFRNDKQLTMFDSFPQIKENHNDAKKILCDRCLTRKYQIGFQKAKQQVEAIFSKETQKQKKLIQSEQLIGKINFFFQKIIAKKQIPQLLLKDRQILRYFPKRIISLDLTNKINVLRKMKCDFCLHLIFSKSQKQNSELLFQKTQVLMIRDKIICTNCILNQFKALKTKPIKPLLLKDTHEKANLDQNILLNSSQKQITLVVLAKSIFPSGTKSIKCTNCEKRIIKLRYFQCTVCKGQNHFLCQQCFWKVQLASSRKPEQIQISDKLVKHASVDKIQQNTPKKSSKKKAGKIGIKKSKSKKLQQDQDNQHQWRLRMIINSPQIRMFCFNCEQQCKIPYLCCETCQNWFWCMKCQQETHKNYAHYNNNHELAMII